MALPKGFVEKNLKKAKGSIFYGVRLEDLTKEELMACVVAGWDEARRAAPPVYGDWEDMNHE